MDESVEEVIREYVEFINAQVGAYIDALAGFKGHHTEIQAQVCRVLRPTERKRDPDGMEVVVWTSYEEPSRPDVILNRIARAADYIADNAPGGSNEQKHARAILVFLFTYWEDEIRPRLARARKVEASEVRSDLMGDVRAIRNAILHSRSVLRHDKVRQLKVLSDLFAFDVPIDLPYTSMHRIFVLLKQDCARMMYEWLGITDSPAPFDQLVDFAVTRGRFTAIKDG